MQNFGMSLVIGFGLLWASGVRKFSTNDGYINFFNNNYR